MRLAWAVALLAGAAGCGFQAQPASQGTDPDGHLVDAGAMVDAGFDFATCPASYAAIADAPSRYRLITTGAHVDAQMTACNADTAGATHLVVFSSPAELTAIAAYLEGIPAGTIHNDTIWVGGVQLRNQASPTTGWLAFDDTTLIAQWDSNEPNDNGGTENNEENFTSLKRGKLGMADSSINTNSGALCECDGVAIGPMAAAAIADNLKND